MNTSPASNNYPTSAVGSLESMSPNETMRSLQFQDRIRKVKAAGKADDPEALEAAKVRQERQDAIASSIQAERLTLPHIPTRQQADKEGCLRPAYSELLMTIGTVAPAIDGVEFPDLPDQRHIEAYNLLPAFLKEHARRYEANGMSVRPSFILKMWIQVLDPHEDDVQAGKFIQPWELRFVVQEMAVPADGGKPQMFNPKNMIAIAARLRKQAQFDGTNAVEKAMLEFCARTAYDYFFYPTVSFREEIAEKEKPTDWCGAVGYPQAFPDDIVPETLRDFINGIVHERRLNEYENGFTTTSAQFLAETMLKAVSYEIRRNQRLTPERVYDLGYRFSISYIQSVKPHPLPPNITREYQKIS